MQVLYCNLFRAAWSTMACCTLHISSLVSARWWNVNSSFQGKSRCRDCIWSGPLDLATLAANSEGTWGVGGAAVVGWLRESRPQTPLNVTPWFNIPSIARNTTLASDCRRLSTSPSSWTAALRSDMPVWEGTFEVVVGAEPLALPSNVSMTGDALWLEVSFTGWATSNAWSSDMSANWGVLLRASGPGLVDDEFTTVSVTPNALAVNLSMSTQTPGTGRGTYVAPISAEGASAGGFRSITVLIDANALEVFGHSDVQGEAVISAFAYPSLSTSTGVYLTVVGGAPPGSVAKMHVTACAMPRASISEA